MGILQRCLDVTSTHVVTTYDDFLNVTTPEMLWPKNVTSMWHQFCRTLRSLIWCPLLLPHGGPVTSDTESTSFSWIATWRPTFCTWHVIFRKFKARQCTDTADGKRRSRQFRVPWNTVPKSKRSSPQIFLQCARNDKKILITSRAKTFRQYVL
jgi:hypothetical protein